MNAQRAILVLMIMGMTVLTGQVMAESVEKMTGYVDLESIAIPQDAEEIRDFDLGPALMSLASDVEADRKNQLTEALSQIQAIRVKSFSITDRDTPDIQKQIDRIIAQLEKKDWHRLIHVKEHNELVTVRIKREKDWIAGLLLIAFEPGAEVTFANVVGQLDLATITGLALGLHGEDFESLFLEIEDLEESEEPTGDRH